ncbi:hypothetical protein CGLAU_03700 [Corynebacterium glaucum]|uniref:Uncharacterized protein n=1 Tax=Corynebacterium glaucum TaxID=187491 RepID=A0A1Q2HV42_9CORY|nr:hypothetical protein CGLAU_03700 [Corynebacterium glaucum]
MSNTQSTRPTASRRRRPVKGLVTGQQREKPEPKAPETWAQRLKQYVPSAVAPLAVLALATGVTCFAVILLSDWGMKYLPAAIGQSWLTLHGVPLRIDGVELSLVPLLPAVGIVALVASRIRAATKTRVSVLDLGAIFVLVTVTSLVLSVVSLFMVADASHVFAIAPPHPAAAILMPLGLHLAGFALGISPVVWRVIAKRSGIPPETVITAGAALRVMRDLVLAAAVVYLVLLALNYRHIAEAVGAYPNLGWSGGLALTLLCLGYLPNAAVATLAVLLGGTFEYAGATVSLFDATSVALPPLPIFAAVPASAPVWVPALMLIPVAVVLRFALTRSFSLIDVAATATWAAVLGLVVASYASGTAGAYGHVGPNPWAFAVLMFLWTALPGLIAWLVSLVRARSAGEDSGQDSGKDGQV